MFERILKWCGLDNKPCRDLEEAKADEFIAISQKPNLFEQVKLQKRKVELDLCIDDSVSMLNVGLNSKIPECQKFASNLHQGILTVLSNHSHQKQVVYSKNLNESLADKDSAWGKNLAEVNSAEPEYNLVVEPLSYAKKDSDASEFMLEPITSSSEPNDAHLSKEEADLVYDYMLNFKPEDVYQLNFNKENVELGEHSQRVLNESVLNSSCIKDNLLTKNYLKCKFNVSVGCNLNLSRYKLTDIERNFSSLIELIPVANLHLDCKSDRLKGISVEIVKRAFPKCNTQQINEVLRSLYERQLQANFYVGEEIAVARCVLDEIETSSIHLAVLKEPTSINLRQGQKCRYVLYLFIASKDVEKFNQALPLIIRKLHSFSSHLHACPCLEGDKEAIWRVMAEIDWRYACQEPQIHELST